MQNKDLRWVRPEYVFGSDEAEKPARAAKRKATKSEPFVDDGKQEIFTVAQIASLWQYSTDTIQRMPTKGLCFTWLRRWRAARSG